MKKSEVRKEAILDTAFKLFFEKGYDATTVRMIMREVGCEIGLFYYYFESKEELFDQIFDKFFEDYKKDFEKLAENAKRDPFRALSSFFDYMVVKTKQFRDNYAPNMHRTIRWSIREQSLTVITPYIRQILEILISYGAKPKLNPEVLSVMLAHGVGNFILHEDSEWFGDVKTEVQKGVNLLMGLNPETADMMFPYFACKQDIEAMTGLTYARKDAFGTLLATDKEQFRAMLAEKIERKEIFVIRHQEKAVGYIAFSVENHTIDIQVTKKECEQHGIGTRLFITALAQFPLGDKLSITIPKDNMESINFYRRFGFQPDGEMQVQDCPCQVMSTVVSLRP